MILVYALGFLFLLLGVGYLRRPDLIARFYAVLRQTLLNEQHIALDRKKWGLFFLLLSFLCFCVGFFVR